MKKSISSVVLFLLFSCAIFAQPVRFGLTFSPQFNWFKADKNEIDNDGLKFGFQYGLLTDIHIKDNDRYAISTGFLINHTGGKIVDATDNTSTLKVNAKLQYIDLPITVKLKSNEVNYMTYFGQIGVTPSFAIRSRGDFTYEPDPTGQSFENQKINDLITLGNVALTVGVGLEYSLAENTAVVGGLYYNNGFINIIDDEDGERITLNSFGIRLGVMF